MRVVVEIVSVDVVKNNGQWLVEPMQRPAVKDTALYVTACGQPMVLPPKSVLPADSGPTGRNWAVAQDVTVLLLPAAF